MANSGINVDHGDRLLTLLELQSRFRGKLLQIRVVCPQHGTAVLKGSKATRYSMYLVLHRVDNIEYTKALVGKSLKTKNRPEIVNPQSIQTYVSPTAVGEIP